MSSTSRPVRNRNQPTRNRDNVELNMELIERLEANKAAKNNNQNSANNAKILVSFINSINQKYRASLLKMDTKKNGQLFSKKKAIQSADYTQWGTNKDKKRYTVNTGTKISTRGVVGGKLQQEVKIDKANTFQQGKPEKSMKNGNMQQTVTKQVQSRNLTKQQKKPVVSTSSTSQQSTTVYRPFKRSSYHIGIAYNIYMHQLKQKNPNLANFKECDPTIFARKLKQSQLKEEEQ